MCRPNSFFFFFPAQRMQPLSSGFVSLLLSLGRWVHYTETTSQLHLPLWSQKGRDSAGGWQLVRALPNASHNCVVCLALLFRSQLLLKNPFTWARVPYRLFRTKSQTFDLTTIFSYRILFGRQLGQRRPKRCSFKKEEGATVLKLGPNLFLHLPTASPPPYLQFLACLLTQGRLLTVQTPLESYSACH